jgi:tetratricopeptide (TPR) repeat protein
MRIGRVILVAIIVAAALSGDAFAVANPAGVATIPPSQIGGGLVTTPNPIDRSGNLVITRNVGGGKEFRGTVPYRSTSEFWAPLGSSSLDSFLRRSYVPNNRQLYTQTYQPYYSPSRTVTTLRPDSLAAERFSTYNTEARVNRGTSLSAVSREEGELSQELSLSAGVGAYSSLGAVRSALPGMEGLSLPGVGTPSDLEQFSDVALERFGVSRLERPVQRDALLEDSSRSPFSPEQFRAEAELAQVRSEAALERDLPGADELPGVGQRGRRNVYGLEGVELSRDGLFHLPEEGTREEAMLPEELARVGESRVVGLPKPTEQTGGQQGDGSQGQMDEAAVGARTGASEQSGVEVMDFGKGIEQTGQSYAEPYRSQGERSRGRPQVSSQDRDRAREILGPYHTVASPSKAKFAEHVRVADEYLRRREYYKAAHSYRLALVYQKREPTAQAGRGHALFVAGEYMSSALFLSRALEGFAAADAKAGTEGWQPEDAAAWLAILRGSFSAIDIDDIENRIVDAEQWSKTSDSGQMHFLLAYVYYQMGRAELANAAIEKAYEKMPEVPAINMLKSAIESAPNADISPADEGQP